MALFGNFYLPSARFSHVPIDLIRQLPVFSLLLQIHPLAWGTLSLFEITRSSI